jgi:dihydrofolate reductase
MLITYRERGCCQVRLARAADAHFCAVAPSEPANVLERRKESEMRKVIVNEFTSLDGVVQAPGAADEDTSGGFEHGGWHLRYFDDVSQKRVLDSIVEAGGFLLGRLTYEIFAAYWPNASEEEQVIAEPLNTKPKYVASTALTEPLAWQNSTLLRGDVSEAVSALKRDDGADVHVIGSTQLVQALIEHGLVDEFRLMIDPVVLGGGKRIFREDGALRTLRLVDGEITSTGAILATYAPAA